MLIDYLRYVAFNGRLRDFFLDGFVNYVDPSDTTGLHLRFQPAYLEDQVRWRGQLAIRDLYLQPLPSELLLERLKDEIGIAGGHTLALSQNQANGVPKTFLYREIRAPKLQVMVDIHPAKWNSRYEEIRSYEETEIVYRPAGPAVGQLSSGDRVYQDCQGSRRHGTLCGVFRASNGQRLALTCAHVVGGVQSQVVVESSRRIWKWHLPIWASCSKLGTVAHADICGQLKRSGYVETRLDAALIELEPWIGHTGIANVVTSAALKPITMILQDEPVQFRGSGRGDTLARVAAVTVRKSIDLFNDGNMQEVGDALMLGHRHTMYTAQRVSHGGDSGAAVRQGFLSQGPFLLLNQWFGMVIGGDDTGSFATHAEHLWTWAAHLAEDLEIQFDFEV